MKIQTIFERLSFALTISSIAFVSCNKDISGSSSGTSTASTIAVAASLSAAAASDSVYVLQPCARRSRRDSISESALPAGVSEYLVSNYPDYTFSKAFSIINSSGTTTGYVVIVYYNDNPVGVEFNSAGVFVKTLEQREKGDLNGKGWHNGGRFECRGGIRKDTVALTALPAGVQSYFINNYPADTLVKAFISKESNYLIISRNNGLFATVLDATGTLVKRVQIPSKEGSCSIVEQSALPAITLAYLDERYPDYVFEKAFSIKLSGTVQGYVVLIDANNTKYALEFDASGNFLKAKTIS